MHARTLFRMDAYALFPDRFYANCFTAGSRIHMRSRPTLLKIFPYIYGKSSGSRLAGTFSVKLRNNNSGFFSVYLQDIYGTVP